jgi:UDP-N-acetylglucosamine--N-acetylmuramyl-(pentapeptide) pyrophosphoryl-undecaprenol N-acetylglucosamine transferase
MKILFTGGGTGGHIFPIIAIARELKKKTGDAIDLSFMGPEDELASKSLFKEGIKTYFVLSGKVRRYFNLSAFFQNIFDVVIRIPLGILQAFLILFFTAPDIIFCKGGYGAIPATVSGWLLGIPIFLHESDVAPGLANKILSTFCKNVFVSFPLKQTKFFAPQKMIEVGNPIRDNFKQIDVFSAKQQLGISSTKPVLLVLGVSQGSVRINDMVLQILPQLLKEFEVIHQTGYKDFERAQSNLQAFVPTELRQNYHVFPFLTEPQIIAALSACNCVVSRAGAGTIFEIAAFKKPSILIPLPESAQNHQVQNAYAYANYGAAIVLEESNLTPNFFLTKITDLATYGNLELMSKQAEQFSRPAAGATIAAYLIEFLGLKII